MSKFDIQLFANVIHGNSNENQLTNTEDNTQIYGLAGNDTLESVNKKNAILIGGSGNDILQMTGGSGTLSGGAGIDTFYLNYSSAATLSAVIEDIDPNEDNIIITYDGKAAPNLNYSIFGNNVIWIDEEGYFNVTLKGSGSSGDYYDKDCNEYIWDVLWLVNQERERQGLNQLILATGLMDATSIRAVEIEDTWGHTRPDGTSCFTAVEKSYSGMGENIAAGYGSSEAVMLGWMNSTGHRENILRDYFKFIGIGYYDKSGSYYGNYWAQMFGGSSYTTSGFTVEEILKTNITTKTGSVPIENPNDKIKISNGNTHIATNGNYKMDDDFSGTIKITTNDAVTIDGTAASSPNDIKILAYSETVNLSINSGDNDNNLIVERASLHNSDISSWQLPASNKITIDGGAGNDSVSNKINNALIFGGAGNDSVSNENNNALIFGGAGNDSIYNEGDSVKIDGGADADYVISKSNNISIFGGTGNDTLRAEKTATYNWDLSAWENTTHNKATIDGGAGNDSVSNENNNALIFGGAGNDSIYNEGDSVKIDGGADADYVISKSDNISIFGGAGNDTLRAEKTATYNWDLSAWENTTHNKATIDGGAGNDYISNENNNALIFGGNDNDNVKNYSDFVKVEGEAGNDIIINGEFFAKGGVKVSLSGGLGNDTITNSGSNSLIEGGAGEDFIHNGSYFFEDWNMYYDSSYNGEHDDSLKSSNVTIEGGAGNDTIYNRGENVIYKYKKGDGNDTVYGYLDSNKIQISASSYTTTESDNNIIIQIESDSITLVDAKTKKLNIVTVSGGTDTTPAETLPAGISIKNSILTASTAFKGNEINLANYAATKVNASALSKAVSIVGTAANNSLKGGKGADTVYGGAGNDTVSLGGGNDVYIYSSGNDLIQDYTTADKIKLASASITSANVSGTNVILNTSNSGKISVKGGKGKEITIIDSNGKETVYGGTETLPAGISIKNSILTASSSFTGKEIDLSKYAATKVNASALSKAVSIIGTAAANSIKGGKGVDTISGGAGNDTVSLGGGNDVYIYSSGNDLIQDYTTSDKIKLASGSVSSASVSGSNVIFKTSNGNITVKNGKGKEIKIVNSNGRETVYGGGTSTSTLPKGLSISNSILTASSSFTGKEIDLSKYAATKVNAAALSKAVSIVGTSANNSLSGGSGKDTISGGVGKDSLFGNNGNDILYGGAGNDYLEGGKGNDSLYGDAGNDSLTGGAGKDVFIFSAGKDTITDYTAGDDKIKIASGTISKTTYSGSNVIFTVGNGTLTVKDGKGKKITVIDSAGKTSTKTYSSGVSAYTMELLDDTNFISDDTSLDSITEQKFSVTEIQSENNFNLAQDSSILAYSEEK